IQIWRLMRRLGLPGAWIGAALFAVHPVHAEVAAWIISIKDLIATLLCLVAVEMFLNHEDRGGWKWLAAAVFAIVPAMLAKSTPTMLPFGLAVLVWYRQGRFTRRDAIGLAVLAAITFAMALADMHVVALNRFGVEMHVPSFPDRLVQSGMAFGFYLAKFVCPVGLSPIYPQFTRSATNPGDWIPLALILLMTFILWRARNRIGRGPLACWLWYAVMLGPTLGIIYFGFLNESPVADRYQFMASIAPLAGVGALIGSWIERRKAIGCALAAALVCLLASLTWHHSAIYRNEKAFFGRAIDLTPESQLAYYNLGVGEWRRNQFLAAEFLFSKAHQYAPKNSETIYALGRVMTRLGKTADTIRLYRDAINGGCINRNVYGQLMWLLTISPDPNLRNPKEALDLGMRYVAMSSNFDPEFLNALAAAQSANGRTREAVDTALRALDLARKTGATESQRKIELMLPFYKQGKPYLAAQ
ncbi:hypothetical protein LLG95_06430, partial [bacterium]|nr:hypothetical protein [bacterium]